MEQMTEKIVTEQLLNIMPVELQGNAEVVLATTTRAQAWAEPEVKARMEE